MVVRWPKRGLASKKFYISEPAQCLLEGASDSFDVGFLLVLCSVQPQTHYKSVARNVSVALGGIHEGGWHSAWAKWARKKGRQTQEEAS